MAKKPASGGGLMERLRKFDAKFSGVSQADVQGGTLPVGTYQGIVGAPSSGIMMAEDADGALRCRIILEVVAADDEGLKGRKVGKSWQLIGPDGNLDERGVSFFKRDMTLLGAEVGSLSDAADALEGVCGAIVQFARVDTAGTDRQGKERVYENVYLNTLVEAAKPAKKARK